MPSHSALAVIAAPPASDTARPIVVLPYPKYISDYSARQQKVWGTVAAIQDDLSDKLAADVRAPKSASSLQLSMEHAKLKEARAAYVAAIEAQGLNESDVIGYVAAVDGKLVRADVYPSTGLFRKMWAKQLAAVVTEAIGARSNAVPRPAPSAAAAQEFLALAEKGTAEGRETAARTFQETRDSAGALYNEARAPSGRWVHRNYLAK
jgi:hypothetical protein